MRRLRHHFVWIGLKFAAGFTPVRMIRACLVLFSVLSMAIGSAAAAACQSDLQIPDQAIRIRVLANSDSEFDQEVKQAVRRQIEIEAASWGPMPDTYEEARALIASRLDDIRDAANLVLNEWNAAYDAEVELGETAFPEKTFGGRVYDAGMYDALRITLGQGEGANWWCVLFPPLCLTAATAPGEETPKAADAADQPVPTAAEPAMDDLGGGNGGEPKAKFFVAEMFSKLAGFLRSLFS